MFMVETTIAGAGNFSAATPVCTFLEELTVGQMPQDWAPRILGYSYATSGAAHGVRLVMAPAAGGAANLEMVLEAPTDPVQNFVQICGKDGIVVPRRLGLIGTTQPLTPADLITTPGDPFVMLFSTTAKQADGTFRVWYAVGPLG